MAARRSPSTEVLAKRHAQKVGDPSQGTSSGDAETMEKFLWNIISINSDFDEISFVWAQMLEINTHQWMILVAIKDLDRGGGVSVKGVSALLHADPSFVTMHSKSLERNGFVRRVSSSEDARIVLMSLTDKACKKIAGLHSEQQSIRESIFAGLNDQELSDLNKKLSMLRERFKRAAKRLAAEL